MSLLELPIPVNMPVNPELATTFASYGLPRTVITELNGLGLYFLVDATWPGELFWLSEATRKVVCDLLAKFGWSKFHWFNDDGPNSRQVLGLHLPWVVLQQHSLIEPLKRELARLTDSSDDGIFGPPTPLALALLPRMKMQEPTHEQLNALLECYGLRQEMTTLDKVFEYQPPPALTNAQIMQLTLDVMGMGLDVPTYTWVMSHTFKFIPQTIDAWLAMLAANDAPWQLKRWFAHHNLPVHHMSAADLERVIMRAKIRE